MPYIAAAALVVLVLLVWAWATHRNARQRPPADDAEAPVAAPGGRPRFDTTIGEFHDLRDALRPLEHTRAASRTLPRGRG